MLNSATIEAPEGDAPSPSPSSSSSRGLADWLLRNRVSLAVTSYQSGRLIPVGVNGENRVSMHHELLGRAMGLWADPQRLFVATQFQMWRFENILPPARGSSMPDRYYVARIAHTTGDLDVHDIAMTSDGRVYFVNSMFSCLAMLSPIHAFRAVWKPPFISKLAAEDRCHLNGLAMKDGVPRYATATSCSDVVSGWRDQRAEGARHRHQHR